MTTGIPTSTNAWGLFTNPVLLETAGVEEFEGGDWEDYTDWLGEVTDGAGGAFWGGTDFTGRIQNFELQLRSEGSYLFSEDGEPGFDEERLTEFWESGADIRDGIGIPQQRLEEVLPKGGFDTALTASRADLGQLRRRLPRRPRRGLHRARPDRSAGDEGRREGPVPEAVDAAHDLGEDRAPRSRRDAGELPGQLARSRVRSSAPTAACRPRRRRSRPPSSTR